MDTLLSSRLLLYAKCTRVDGLLPTATLRAGPPSQVKRSSSVIVRPALVFTVVPVCSCARVKRLKGVAFAGSPASTEGTARQTTASSVLGCSRPAVLLPCWALAADPEDLLAASQCHLVRPESLSCIAMVIPLCQKGMIALCKAWVLGLCLIPLCIVGTLLAASLPADPVMRCCLPLVATDLPVPADQLMALCDDITRGSIICFIIPPSRNRREPW